MDVRLIIILAVVLSIAVLCGFSAWMSHQERMAQMDMQVKRSEAETKRLQMVIDSLHQQ